MSYLPYNPNPSRNLVGDCVIRAVSLITNQDWETTYVGIVTKGLEMHDMPSSNAVWGAYLHDKGFVREGIPNTCPDCYTIKDFTEDNPYGIYLVATGTHVVAVIDGDYYDTWDSGNEIPIYVWRKE